MILLNKWKSNTLTKKHHFWKHKKNIIAGEKEENVELVNKFDVNFASVSARVGTEKEENT